LFSDGKSTLGDNGGVQQAERSSQDRGGQTDRVRIGREARRKDVLKARIKK